jgi:hypothetical protein
MPYFGTLDVSPLLASAPMMENFDAEAWEIAGVETLQVTFEIDDARMVSLLPKALHPTIPPIVIFTVARYPDSPVGAFTMAQVRLGCRAAALPRGYLLRAYIDSAAACDALARNWGFACREGNVRLQRYHDRITGSVAADGAEVLRVSLIDPEPVSGGDIQYVANMHLARTAEDAGGVLVQVDPEFRFHRAERGRPEVATFDRAAWAADGVDPVWPIVASYTVCDTGFPRIRYVLDPEKPAVVGTRKLRG